MDFCRVLYASSVSFTDRGRIMTATTRQFTETVREVLKACDEQEQRQDFRHPFFRPATVTREDGTTYQVFTRDISRSGLGLLHKMPLEPGRIQVTIQLRTGTSVELEAELLWCEASRSSRFVSGARFLSEVDL